MRALSIALRLLIPVSAIVLSIFRQFTPALMFSGSAVIGWRLAAVIVIAAAVVIRAASILRAGTDESRRGIADDVEVASLTLVAVYVVVQALGTAQREQVYPLLYLLLSVFVIHFGLRTALICALGLGIVDALESALNHQPGSALADSLRMMWNVGTPDGTWTRVFLHVLVSVAFIGMVGLLLLGERRMRDRAVATLVRLTSDARDLAPDERNAIPAVLRDTVGKNEIKHTRELDSELADLMDIGRLSLRAGACVALFLTPDGKFARTRAYSAEAGEIDTEAVVPTDNTLIALVLRRNEAVVIGRLDPGQITLEYRRRRTRTRSVLAAPLRFDNRVLGLLIADSDRVQAFDSVDVQTSERLANRVVDAFQTARSVAGISREREEFAAFFNFARRFTETLTVDEVMLATFEAGDAVLTYSAAVIHISESDAENGHVAAVRNLSAKCVGMPVRHAVTLAGRAIKERRIFSFRRPLDADVTLYNSELKLRALSSGIVVPIQHRGGVMGTVGFFWDRVDAFTDYELRLFESLVATMAIALNDARQYEVMEQLATTDALTELANRRTFQAELADEIHRFERLHQAFSLVMLDIDYFKKVNDTYGHPAGDEVLRFVSKTIRAEIRSIDMAARIGGEEFALLLPATRASGAKKFAERLRKRIAGSAVTVPGGATLRVTISMGVACCPEDTTSPQGLIDAADRALYFSKEAGRNRVTAAEEISRT